MSSNNTPDINSDQPIPTEMTETNQSTLVVQAASLDPERFPDLDNIESVILKQGPRSIKQAKYTTIRNRHTGTVHHYSLSIQTLGSSQKQWKEKPEKSITLESKGDDEIQKLMDFLAATHGNTSSRPDGDYTILKVPTQDINLESLQQLLSSLSISGRVDALTKILEFAEDKSELFNILVERVDKDPQLFADAAAALNLATYKNAVDKLKNLIDSGKVSESQFQKILEENPWMFGSEYSAILDRRTWTRDEQQDFVVRRTTDNYMEIIEIKTPLEGKTLFIYDKSHKSYYPAVELSKVIGQVQNYLEKLDGDRNSILANDGEDTNKIRAKIIIGRDGDKDQQKALRRFNGHLYRIEIITFDQLLRIAQNVLNYLQGIFIPRN
ncbi:MAG: Shedu anti-phage system protein SduA domain-containing protein [Sphaerospermopsis kisseleviana]